MGWIKALIAVVVVAVVAHMVVEMLREPPMPILDPNPWWGPRDPQPEDLSINRFTIKFSKEDVDDLKARLAQPMRLTPPLEDSNFTYGMNSKALQNIVQYWQQKYDWHKREAKLNLYPHFRTRIEGLDVHFMRAEAKVGKAKNVKVLPLLLIHGWPGSFVEFYDILPLLTTPQEGSDVVFDVICPSIPGYGFSEGSAKQGFGHLETAQVFLKLMKRLSFEQFYVQGGDWGSIIATDMATMYPEHILGVHVNMIAVNPPLATIKLFLGAILPSGIVVAKEDEKNLYPLWKHFSILARESGYLHIQATKPDTIGTVLNQNPVSLAAYILEKFSTWTHKNNLHLPDGGLLQKDFPISLDNILDNICIYWFTSSITTSVRYYSENINKKAFSKHVDYIPCRVPAGLAAFPQELANHPKNLAAHKYHDIVSYSVMPSGGHFAAMECPTLLAEDIYSFVNAVEKRSWV